MRHPLQDSLICLSAATAGVAAGRGEADKDSHHEASVRAAGGIFIPLVVESLGLWCKQVMSLPVSPVLVLTHTPHLKHAPSSPISCEASHCHIWTL